MFAPSTPPSPPPSSLNPIEVPVLVFNVLSEIKFEGLTGKKDKRAGKILFRKKKESQALT